MRTWLTALMALAWWSPALQASPAKEVVSKEGGFAVTMPCEPKYEMRPVETAQGTVSTHQYYCESAGFMAMVSWVQAPDLGGDPEQRLDNTREGSVGRLRGGKLVGEQKISVGGHPGRAIRAEAVNDQLVIARFILVQKENRLFTILAGTNKSKAPEKEIQAFLQSFRFVAR